MHDVYSEEGAGFFPPDDSATPFEILGHLVGQKIMACSTTTDLDELKGFHLLGEDGYAVTVKGHDLTVEAYKGWVIASD